MRHILQYLILVYTVCSDLSVRILSVYTVLLVSPQPHPQFAREQGNNLKLALQQVEHARQIVHMKCQALFYQKK